MTEQLKSEIKDLNQAVQQNKMPLAQAEGQVLAKEAEIYAREDQERETKIKSQIDQLKQEIQELNLAVQQHKTSLAIAESEVLTKEEEIHKLEAKLASAAKAGAPEAEPVPEAEPAPKPETIKPEKYLDIDPAKIKEVLNPEELSRLKNLQEKYLQAQTDLKLAKLKNEPAEELQKEVDSLKDQIDTFYRVNLDDILYNTKNKGVLSEEEIAQAAQKIKQVIEDTIDLEANREMAKMSKKLGPMAQMMLKNSLVVAGTSMAVASLGITGFGGVIALSGATTLVRHFLSRKQKSEAAQSKSNQKFEQDLGAAKAQALDDLFSDVDLLRQKISGHISNVLREVSSARALADLASHEPAIEPNNTEFLKNLKHESDYKNYRDIYLRALTKVKAEYPDEDLEVQKKRAITMARSLGQHQRQDQATVDALAKIKADRPKVYALIEKYGALMSGRSLDNASEDDKAQARFLYSLGLGTATGVAIRSSGIVRMIAGAAAGAGAGKAFSENFDSEQGRIFKELEKMLDEVEKNLADVEFPVKDLEKFRRQKLHVESRLEMGLLDTNPLLKSRAENFVHQVQKLETFNQENLSGVLNNINADTQEKIKIKQNNLERLNSKIKKKRWMYIVGGSLLGAGSAWLLGELGHKDEAKADTIDHTAHAESTHIPMGKVVDAPPDTKFELPIEHEPTPTHFEDMIQSHDSIWQSTKNIFVTHSQELGYKGDPSDQEALDFWAERQTANAVNDMRFEQGGNLADLVHEGDKVTIDMVDGHAKLHFEASSGIEPGHLDAASHVQVAEAASSSMPAAEVPAAAPVTEAVDVFHQALASQDRAQIDHYVQEYFQSHNLPADKQQIFAALLRNNPDLAKYEGTMDDLVKNFDSHVRQNFDHFRDAPKYQWLPAKIGDHYALIKKIDGRWGLAGYQLDLNGDGQPDKIINSNVQLREAFKKGRF